MSRYGSAPAGTAEGTPREGALHGARQQSVVHVLAGLPGSCAEIRVSRRPRSRRPFVSRHERGPRTDFEVRCADAHPEGLRGGAGRRSRRRRGRARARARLQLVHGLAWFWYGPERLAIVPRSGDSGRWHPAAPTAPKARRGARGGDLRHGRPRARAHDRPQADQGEDHAGRRTASRSCSRTASRTTASRRSRMPARGRPCSIACADAGNTSWRPSLSREIEELTRTRGDRLQSATTTWTPTSPSRSSCSKPLPPDAH